MRREMHVAMRQPRERCSSGAPGMLISMYRETCGCLPQGLRAVHPHNESPSHHLGEQARRRRIVLERRQMCCNILRASKPWPIRPRQIERADPERTGDGAHEHRAIARKPGQPARVERLLRARLVAFAQFLRGDGETAQDRRINSLRAMQPADPEPRDIRRDRNRAIPGQIQTPPACASNVRAAIRALPETRACMQKSKKREFESRKSGAPPIPAARQSRRWSASSAYSPKPPSAARGQGGARLVDGQNAFRCIARKDAAASRRAAPAPSLARDPTSKTGIGGEAGTQFVPSMRAYSAHNHLRVNGPAPCRFAQSYTIHVVLGANQSYDEDSWPSRWTSFARRLGLDRQGMHASIEFSPQEMIDRTMALDQALALKGFRNYFDVKVGSARARGRARPVHGMSVARVHVGFVDDFDGGGGKGGL
jgi:hypothetical protein